MRWFAFLGRWLRQAPAPRTDLHFILYTRSGCPLCDEAWDLLQPFQQRYEFSIETRNVDESVDLRSAYGNCVPVVTINGRLRFRGHVNPVLLERILENKASAFDRAN